MPDIYWTAFKDGVCVEEGVNIPTWYRWMTSILRGYDWEGTTTIPPTVHSHDPRYSLSQMLIEYYKDET